MKPWFAVGLKDLYEKAEAYLLAKQELNRAEAALCVYPESSMKQQEMSLNRYAV